MSMSASPSVPKCFSRSRPTTEPPRPGMYSSAGCGEGGVLRRASFPTRAASSGSLTLSDTDAAPVGLPMHFSGSQRAKSTKKEKLLCWSSFTLLLALSAAAMAVVLLVRAHARQGQELVSHHAGWTATYDELLNKHEQLTSQREELRRSQSQLESKGAQLSGAAEQLQLFHSALQHKDATLGQLLDERAALQAEVRTLTLHAQQAVTAARHDTAHPLASELKATQQEAEELRGALQRCFADYTSALEALQAEQRASETHGAFGAHAVPRWADKEEEQDRQQEGHRDAGWGDAAARHFHDSLAQADRARM